MAGFERKYADGGILEKPGYNEYLALLEQRNKLVKKLRAKDEKQLELEKKEQGFSLYLNGANVDLHINRRNTPDTSRKTRTAAEQRAIELNISEDENESRSRTAPSKPTRKGWAQSTPREIKIKTTQGVIKEDLIGNYSEDFEVYQSMLEERLEKENTEEEEYDDDDGMKGDDKDDVDSIDESHSDTEDETSQDSDSIEDDDTIIEAKLTFSKEDCKALRKSLESDSKIRDSIASIGEDINMEESINNSLNRTAEILDEIEEEIVDEVEEEESAQLEMSKSLEEIEEEIEALEKTQPELKFVKSIPTITPMITASRKDRPVSSSCRPKKETDVVVARSTPDLIAAIV